MAFTGVTLAALIARYRQSRTLKPIMAPIHITDIFDCKKRDHHPAYTLVLRSLYHEGHINPAGKKIQGQKSQKISRCKAGHQKNQTLQQNVFNNPCGFKAQGFEQPEFPGSFQDGHEHGIDQSERHGNERYSVRTIVA